MNIKTLNKSIEIAEKYNDDIPTKRTLSRWVKRGVLSNWEQVEHFGQQGTDYLYPDSLPVEIIAAIELKGKLTLDEIAKARQGESEFTKIYQQKLEEIKKQLGGN